METQHNSSSIEHQNVPINHRGLHDFLYSSDDEHTAIEVSITPELANDGTEIIDLETWSAAAQNAKIAGVYAVLDAVRCTQHIGYSRNVLLSLNGHVTKNGKQKCAFVRVQAFKFPKRQEMEDLRDAWIAELESTPPGNATDRGMWASTVGEAAKAVMSEAERQAYEEKKLKLRKAMADTTLSKESETIDASEVERQRQLEAAVTNDDWSVIIDAQTQETKS